MSGSGSGPLVPTFNGFVQNSMDGLVLFEACLSGKLHHVPRRPHDRERSSLIKSGSIFIYEENASGIKRWTDGVAWSPSRILGNFLIYRELEKPFPPGEKKRAMKRKRSSQLSDAFNPRESEEIEVPEPVMPPAPEPPKPVPTPTLSDPNATENDKEMERQLIGSLVDSYGFRPEGLVKKTMSISINGISHHLVSYYKVDDVKNGNLARPLSDPRLANISVRPDLYMKQNFRAPIHDNEHYALDAQGHALPGVMYPSVATGGYNYGMAPAGYPMYHQGTSAPMYAPVPQTAWPAPQDRPASASWSGMQGEDRKPVAPPYTGHYSNTPSQSTPRPGPASAYPSFNQQPHYQPPVSSPHYQQQQQPPPMSTSPHSQTPARNPSTTSYSGSYGSGGAYNGYNPQYGAQQPYGGTPGQQYR